MNILQSIFYGLISGLSRYLPISSQGHQQLFRTLFGVAEPEPICAIFVHLAVLGAVIFSCSTYIEKLRRTSRADSRARRRIHNRSRREQYDIQLLKNAAVFMLIGMIVFRLIFRSELGFAWLAFFFLINGIILYLPEYMPHANKDAQSMSLLDSVLIGIAVSLCVLPGFSGVGAAVSAAVIRGADIKKAYDWILILAIPALLVQLVFDVILIFVSGIGTVTFLALLGYIVSAIFAFAGALAGIYIMRMLVARSGFSAFAFYCWSAALLIFLLYLTV